MKAIASHILIALISACAAVFTSVAAAADHALPDPTSGEFCQAVQRTLANTEISGTVEVFDNMPDYRASKPSPDPLMIYQVVTYDEKRPVTVSCKVKTADHLRATYGEDAAGEQQRCAVVANIALQQAIRELEAEYPEEAAARAREFIIDDNEPYLMGSEYLADFELSYLDPEGKVHIQSPGLQTDWESWINWIMPDMLMGQTYCHLATVPYLKALATGAVEAGTARIQAAGAWTRLPAAVAWSHRRCATRRATARA